MTSRPLGSRLAELLRYAATAGIAGALTGFLVGGLVARLVMRLSAIAAGPEAAGLTTEAGNTVGEITAEGTVSLLLFEGITTAGLGAVTFALCDPWLRWAGRWRGVLFGAVLLAVGSPMALDPGNIDFLLLDPASLNVAMFSTLYLMYGVTFVFLHRWLDARLPEVGVDREPPPIGRTVAYGLLALLGLPFLALLFSGLFVEMPFPVADRLSLGFLAAMAFATLVWWVRYFRGGPARGWAPEAVVGHLAVAGTLMSGAIAVAQAIRLLL